MPNNPHYYISKVSLVSLLARNECQSWIFLVQIIKAPCDCPPFPAGNSSFGVNTPSSSGNVYITNGQTNRIQKTEYSCPIDFEVPLAMNCLKSSYTMQGGLPCSILLSPVPSNTSKPATRWR
jgi:hypothetical protein